MITITSEEKKQNIRDRKRAYDNKEKLEKAVAAAKKKKEAGRPGLNVMLLDIMFKAKVYFDRLESLALEHQRVLDAMGDNLEILKAAAIDIHNRTGKGILLYQVDGAGPGQLPAAAAESAADALPPAPMLPDQSLKIL